MPNAENLKPNTERTPTERKELAKRMGQASGLARKAKKSLCESLKELVAMKAPEGSEIASILDKYGVKDRRIGVALALAMVNKAAKGDVAAFTAIRDSIGEKPSDNVNIDIPKSMAIAVVNVGGEYIAASEDDVVI